MKKWFISIVIIIAAIAGIYYAGIQFYQDKFLMNVSLNNFNLGNMTLQEAKNNMTDEILNNQIDFMENGQKKASISLNQAEPSIYLEKSLSTIFDQQDPNRWPLALFEKSNTEVKLDKILKFDKDRVIQLIKDSGLSNEGRQESTFNTLSYSDGKGFFIDKGINGDTLDFNAIYKDLKKKLANHETKINLADNYETSDSVSDMPSLTKQMNGLNAIREGKADITYLIAGEEYHLDGQRMMNWAYLDENNLPAFDSEQMRQYLTEVAAETSTYGRERQFQSTLQELVTVPPGIMGAEIDVETEIGQLSKDLLEGGAIKRKPAFVGYGLRLGEEDEIGDTYVEVDLTNQMEFLYINGSKILETPINSGKPVTPTTPGANVIVEMRTNTELRGINPITKEKYASPVVYWMRFDNYAQGIHDASWAPGFGGNTYTWGGSLGCINTPLWAAEQIYLNVQLGTPVVVFP